MASATMARMVSASGAAKALLRQPRSDQFPAR
jgi:hypothetical protein